MTSAPTSAPRRSSARAWSGWRGLRRARWVPGGAAGALAAAAAVTALVVILVGGAARHGAVLVHQCVPGDGGAGWLGLRLALLRPDAECPAGTLAVGADGRQVLSVVVLVALPVLLAHLAGLATGLGLLARLRVLVRTVATVLGRLGSVPRDQAPVLVVARRPAVAPALVALVGDALAAVPWRRGPPALQLA